MYRVVIADDNALVREALCKTIPWKKLNMIVVGSAEDGQQEKFIIDAENPDIIITDICMPGFSGLEVTEYSREKNSKAIVILITGYNNFQYAQKAIKLQVFDFVLKPINNDELVAILKRAGDELGKEKDKRKIHDQLVFENEIYKKEFSDVNRLLNARIYRALANGRNLSEREFQGVIENDRRYIYVTGKIRAADSDKIKWAIDYISKGDLFYKEQEYYCLEANRNQNIELLFLYTKKDSASMIYIRLKKRLLELIHILEQKEIEVCFAISRLSDDIEQLKNMREQTVDSLEAASFVSNEKVLYSWHYNVVNVSSGDGVIYNINEFYKFLGDFQRERLEEEVEKLLLNIAKSVNGNEFQIKCFLSEMCITMYRKFYVGRKAVGDNEKGINDILKDINSLSNMKKTKKYLEDFVSNLQDLQKEEIGSDNPLIKNAILYIKNHYEDSDLSLTSVADSLNLNSSYLSRLLKKETGMKFIDLLTNVRIDKAKRLLLAGMKATEVGMMVGYKDYTYFYQVFKKTEGKSPSDYIKNNQNI